MTCIKNELRIVRGNAFAVRLTIEARRLDGTVIDDFDLSQAEATLNVLHAGKKTASTFTVTGNDATIAFNGTQGLGWYGLEMAGTYQGSPWRWCVNEIFQIVETNAKANVPSWTILADTTYLVDGVLTIASATDAVQADWNETNPQSAAYIKNKPAVVSPTQLQQAIGAEKERAEAAERANADAIGAEENRAKEAEQANANAIAVKYTKPAGGIPSTDMTQAVQTSLQKADNAASQTEVDGIEAKIPAAASAENQLADKNFVNSSIATATATYRGSYNVVSDLSLPADATHAQIEAAIATKLAALGIVADNNDYCFVQMPTATTTPTEIASIERYKFNGTAWSYEYTLNNSGFTADQWAAINSGITSGAVAKLAALPTNAELTILLNGKQDTISDIQTIRSGAAAGATAYQKPAGGIPSTDMTQAVQTSLQKADNAAPQATTYTKTEIDTNFVGAPGQSVLAQAFAVLLAAIDGLKAQFDNLGETKAVSIDFEEQPKLCGQPLVIEGSGAPAAPVVPTMVGQRYHDTTNRKVYEAFAVTNSVSDWVLLN